MKKIILLPLAFAFLLSACKKDDNNSTTNPNNTTTTTSTIKVGSKWTFKRTDYDDQTGTNVISTTNYTLTVIRDSTINNEKWMILQHSNGQYGLVKFATDGMYIMSSSGARLKYKKSAAVNDTWTDESDQTCKVVSTNQTVTVPKGTFNNAYYVESSDANSLENKIWYNETEYMLIDEEYDDSPTTPGTMILDYRDELVNVQY